MTLQNQLTQTRIIIWPPTQWPKELSITFFNWQIINTGVAQLH